MTTLWTKSSVDRKAFDELRLNTVIPKATNTIRWRILPRTEVEPRPEENEVVSFAYFHSFGFGVPAHPLLRWLLYYYGLHLHDLTLDAILHLSIFIMLCEGFLGIPAHYELWQSFISGGLLSAWGGPSSSDGGRLDPTSSWIRRQVLKP